ncbi:hypothetical protein MRX96_009740 [Rhipicephalus microplus]
MALHCPCMAVPSQLAAIRHVSSLPADTCLVSHRGIFSSESPLRATAHGLGLRYSYSDFLYLAVDLVRLHRERRLRPPQRSKERHKRGMSSSPAFGRLPTLSALTGRLQRQPALLLRSSRVHACPALIRQPVEITPTNLGNCIVRSHHQVGTLARSDVSENYGAAEDQLWRQQCERRGHGVPSQVFLAKPVPSEKRSRPHVFADSAIENQPPENTRPDNRRHLHGRLMPSSARPTSPDYRGSDRHPSWSNKDNFRYRINRTKLPARGGNPEQDAEVSSRCLAEATARRGTLKPGGRSDLGTHLSQLATVMRPVESVPRSQSHEGGGWRNEWKLSISSVQPHCAGRSTARSFSQQHFGIQSKISVGESDLLYWTSDIFGTEYSADSDLLSAGNEMATTSDKQARCAGAATDNRARHEAEKQEQRYDNIWVGLQGQSTNWVHNNEAFDLIFACSLFFRSWYSPYHLWPFKDAAIANRHSMLSLWLLESSNLQRQPQALPSAAILDGVLVRRTRDA